MGGVIFPAMEVRLSPPPFIRRQESHLTPQAIFSLLTPPITASVALLSIRTLLRRLLVSVSWVTRGAITAPLRMQVCTIQLGSQSTLVAISSSQIRAASESAGLPPIPISLQRLPETETLDFPVMVAVHSWQPFAIQRASPSMRAAIY